jgi:hypothetical protein
MINRQTLLSDLQKLLQKLEADLLERSMSAEVPEVGVRLKEEHARATKAQRTAQNYEDWRTDAMTQAAAAWVLSCVFVRFLEDNRLIDPPKISGPASGGSGQSENRLGRARDEHELYFRKHPKQTDREYLLSIFDQLAKLPGTKDVFGEHNPIRELPNWLSGDAAGELLKFFQKIDANTGALVHDFTDASWDTRFLGDLYQDLSEAARKKYALLQTPEFVEEFILDRTLNPALDEFGLEPPPTSGEEDISYDSPSRDSKLVTRRFRMIDPACGSGHFLLGSFPRILGRWMKKDPGTNVRELVQRTLHSIHGVDVNPFAIAIARFRLLLSALKACGIQRLADAPAFEMNLVCGDSLLHVPLKSGGKKFTKGQLEFDNMVTDSDGEVNHAYQSEDLAELKRLVRPGQYHAVVANPPYITPKDRALNEQYRNRFESCHMKYSLAAPFMEQLFRLATISGYTGQITANSFMKREFGKKLIEEFLPTVETTHVIDSSGAYIPGHNTPTVILFGRNRRPITSDIRTVMGIKGDPVTPSDPSRGPVWTAILTAVDNPHFSCEYLSSADIPRETLFIHPWSIGGGGAAELKAFLDEACSRRLGEEAESIGIMCFTLEDDVFFNFRSVFRRNGIGDAYVRPVVEGSDIKNWLAESSEAALFPYDSKFDILQEDPKQPWRRYLWAYRSNLSNCKMFGGESKIEAGLKWYEYGRLTTSKCGRSHTFAFSEVSSHNHFFHDRGEYLFSRSANIIQFPVGTVESDLAGLLGVMNSSIACFWLKQVSQIKTQTTGMDSDSWRLRRQFNGTKLEKLPIPEELPINIGMHIDKLAANASCHMPGVILRDWPASKSQLSIKDLIAEHRQELVKTISQMIHAQEELDWELYRRYSLTSADMTHSGSEPIVRLGQRAFEIVMARRVAGGQLNTTWFDWHGIAPSPELPISWPDDYRQLVERRIALIESDPNIRLIEQPEYKRRWNTEPWESQLERALREWLLNRLEGYFDSDGRMKAEQQGSEGAGEKTSESSPLAEIQLVSVARLASVAGQDADFLQVGELYRDDAAFDVQALVTELVAPECVPLLPVLRYKPAGLIKRTTWERTWDLQRQEDVIDARTQLPATDPNYLPEDAAKALKEKQVGKIPVPTKYDSKDFLTSDFWRLRGKLDVPKERWISFPHCDGPDGTMMLCWAGYDHLQQARAISAYYVQVQTEFGGTDDPRLIPLLACLIELLPWLKQWHNDLDAEFNMSMGDYFEGFINEEARQLGKTLQEIREWVPPAKTAVRRSRRSK